MKNRLFSIASLSMALAVACGAFGAHVLREVVPPNDMEIWEKSVLYHVVHALATLVILITPSTLCPERTALKCSVLFLVGTVFFSGSLYALVLSNVRWLGAITPIGGVMFIVSWVLLGFAVSRNRRE